MDTLYKLNSNMEDVCTAWISFHHLQKPTILGRTLPPQRLRTLCRGSCQTQGSTPTFHRCCLRIDNARQSRCRMQTWCVPAQKHGWTRL